MFFALLYGIVQGQEMLVRKIHGPFSSVRKSLVGPQNRPNPKSRGGYNSSACRTIRNQDQDFWLAKFHLNHSIALKNGPWSIDILAKSLINVCFT